MRRALAVFAALGLVLSASVAIAGTRSNRAHRSDVMAANAASQHGEPGGHLPASKKNIKVIAKLRLGGSNSTTDVDEWHGYAYIGTDYSHCADQGGDGKTGAHVIDVRDPAHPKKVAFIPVDSRVGEGIHAFSAKSKKFDGDLLVLSNESCAGAGPGGITVVDVSNPAKPKILAEHAGDTDLTDPADPTPAEFADDVHSVMGWSTGGHIYAVMTDNFETLDVDIMDLTDPSNPKLISETGAEEWPDLKPQVVNGESIFSHDFWVKKIGGHWMLMVSNWDVGWVLLNVDDPANPVYVNDSDYAANDPELPQFSPPEGNAHQGSWSTDNKFWIGTDEDFGPYRLDPFEITTGANAGEYPGGEFGFTIPMTTEYTDHQINGPTKFVGTACPPVADDPATPEDETDPGTASLIPDASTVTVGEGEEKIAVVLRGTCFFSEKIEQVQLKGWDAAVVANHHAGSGAGELPDAILCGSQGHEFTPTINAICIGHRAFHLLFNQAATYEGADEPAIGTVGDKIRAVSAFDGWGYAHLLDANTLEEIDTYAIPEEIDPAFGSAEEFGVQSAHEVETDKRNKHIAYFSWYSGGARVVKFGPTGMTEVGHFIDTGGNDFWGVETIKRGKKRPILLYSDRDFGLYVLQYTGKE
jgi:hypothetical protein